MIEEIAERIREAREVDNRQWDRLVTKYRGVFNTTDGREVLIDILNDLGFFSNQITTAEETVLQNYARILFAKCGAWQAERLPGIVAVLLNEE